MGVDIVNLLLEEIYKNNNNLIISGAISSGKTAKIVRPLVKKIIDNKESLFILDSKEEYINNYLDLLKEKEYNIHIINFKDLSGSDRWNLLEYPYYLYKQGKLDKSIEQLEDISKMIFDEYKSADPLCTTLAIDLFVGIVLGLFEDINKPGLNLLNIFEMLNVSEMKIDNTDYLTEYFKRKGFDNIAYKYTSPFIFADARTKEGAISIARQKIMELVTKNMFIELSKKTTFDYKIISKKPTAVFLIVRNEKYYIEEIITVFIMQLYYALLDFKCNKFNFILDNFDLLHETSNLPYMLSTAVTNKMRFIIVTRARKLLETYYGEYMNYLVDEIMINKKEINAYINEKNVIIDNK